MHFKCCVSVCRSQGLSPSSPLNRGIREAVLEPFMFCDLGWTLGRSKLVKIAA